MFNIEKRQEKEIQKYNSMYIIFLFILSKFMLVTLSNLKDIINFKSHDSEIYLVIQGNGSQNIISNSFNYVPSEVWVNRVKNDSCDRTCYLTEDRNNIILKFENQVI